MRVTTGRIGITSGSSRKLGKYPSELNWSSLGDVLGFIYVTEGRTDQAMLWVATNGKRRAYHDKDSVKDASLTQTYSFLPASWAGDTHEETNFLPIGDREEKERCLNRCTDSLEVMQVLMVKYLADGRRGFSRQRGWIASDE